MIIIVLSSLSPPKEMIVEHQPIQPETNSQNGFIDFLVINDRTSSQSFESITARLPQNQIDNNLMPIKIKIDQSNCHELEDLYETNPGWTLRPYIKYKMENECD